MIFEQMKAKFAAIAATGTIMFGGMTPAFAAETTDEAISVDVAPEEAQNAAPAAEAESASEEKSNGAEVAITAGTVKHILISGNVDISKEDLLKYVTNTKIGEEYSRETVTQDVQAIAQSGLVQSVKAKALQNNGELYVVFEVQEVSNVVNVAFEGNTILSSEQLASVIGVQVGEKFSPDEARQDAEKIRNAYASQGFIAIVSDINNNDGVVTYTIREAKIGDVTYEGNKKTKTWVLEKLAGPYLQKGAFLRNDMLQAAYNSLSGSGYFGNVKIDAVDIPEEPGSVALQVKVKETSTGAWNIGGAYSDTYGAELVGGIYDKNLGGSAKTAALDFGIGTKRNHYSLTFTDPYWRKSNASVYAKAFKTEKDVDNDYFEYTEGHTGGEIGFSKPVSHNGRTNMYANVLMDKVDVKDQERGESLDSFQENSITVGVINDGRNMSTGSGTVLEGSATASLEAIGSDMDFTKFKISAKSYKRLSNRDMLAARAVLNYSPDNLPGVEQFTIGGSDSVRGIKEDEQRGDRSVLGSIELRHDFTDKIQGVVFADIGKAWSDEINNELKTAAGLGLRIKTALGVLRLDAAKAAGNNVKFLFGIGQTF